MAIDVGQIVYTYVMPVVKTIAYGAVGLGLVGGLWYYLFIIKSRRKWFIRIWEQKADKVLHYISTDILIERKINKGKQTIYLLTRNKSEATPPSWQCVNRIKGKEWADYLRVQNDLIPVEKIIDKEVYKEEVKKSLLEQARDTLKDIRKTKTTKYDTEEIYQKYLYVPIHKALHVDMTYQPIDYDVNMMRINAIDNRDKIYRDKEDFWQRWGTLISIGIAAVVLIVVAYLSFEYMNTVIKGGYAAADKVAGPLQSIVDKLGGSPPAG